MPVGMRTTDPNAALRRMGKTLDVRLTDGTTRQVRSAGAYLTKAGLHVFDGHGVELITNVAEIARPS
jgi:hypothetical protein